MHTQARLFNKLLLSALILCASYTSNAQSGCTDPNALNYNSGATINDGSCTYPYTHVNPSLLGMFPGSTIQESSGLVLTDGKLWTHNDSGNPPDIFSVDSNTGAILQTVIVDNHINTDWEDITADSNYIYISDCGNNNGTRKDLKILRIAKTDIGSGPTVHVNADTIALSYNDQTSFVSSSTHNFDCESVISFGINLYIFTKDRGDLKTRVYKLPKTPGKYPVSPIDSFNANGLVTGADYNPVTKQLVLIGYMSGHLSSFLWFFSDFAGDKFFSGNKRRIEISNGGEWQTEGVCFRSNNSIYISCEDATVRASLFKQNITWNNTGVNSTILEKTISIYPNPNTGTIYAHGYNPSVIRVTDINGKLLKEVTNTKQVSISDLPNGIYFVQLLDATHLLIAEQKIVKE